MSQIAKLFGVDLTDCKISNHSGRKMLIQGYKDWALVRKKLHYNHDTNHLEELILYITPWTTTSIYISRFVQFKHIYFSYLINLKRFTFSFLIGSNSNPTATSRESNDTAKDQKEEGFISSYKSK